MDDYRFRHLNVLDVRSVAKKSIVFWSLVLISAVGLMLRLYHLNFQSLWYDELHSIIPTNPANSVASLIEYCKDDQPPAYFLVLHFIFQVFGYNEVVGRLVSVVLGVIGIPVMYMLAKEIKGQAVGMCAALLTSFNYMHIYYSQELRFYTLTFLATALSFFFLIRAFKRVRNWDFVLYTLSTTTLVYTHYYGLVVFASQIIILGLLVIYKKEKTFIGKAIVSGISVLVFYVPWFPIIFNDLGIESFWIQMPEPFFLVDYFYYYFGKDAFVTVVFTVFSFLFFRSFLKNRTLNPSKRAVYVVVLSWLVLSYLIPYVRSFLGTPVLYVRYTIISLPAWILIISLGWEQVINLKLRYGLIGLISVSSVLNLFFFRQHYFRVDKQQFREVSALVKEKEGQPVYSLFPWHFSYYFRGEPVQTRQLDLNVLPEENMIWLLHVEFFDPQEREEVLGKLRKNFKVVDTYSFHKTEAILLARISN